MDTHRTFPTNVFFAGSGPGVAKLRRVLIAYSWRDPAIGYCQGMNLLAALLLLVYPDEEDAFWMLASVLERTLPSDYYSSQLLVSQADQRVLKDLIQLALPDVSLYRIHGLLILTALTPISCTITWKISVSTCQLSHLAGFYLSSRMLYPSKPFCEYGTCFSYTDPSRCSSK